MGNPNEGLSMDAGLDAGPGVQLAFDLADAGMGGMGNDEEEPRIDPEEEEDVIRLVWDQAESEEEEEDDPWQTADERERWEENKQFRIEYGQYVVILLYRSLTSYTQRMSRFATK